VPRGLHPRRRDGVVHLRAEHAANGFVEQASPAQLRVLPHDVLVMFLKEGNLCDLFQRDQPGAHPVVDVVRVVCNLVGKIAQLRFETRLRAVDEPPTDTARLLLFQPLRVRARAMLEDSLPRLEAEIQAIESRITFFQLVDDAQTLQVVLEAAIRSHAFIQRVLASVPKRRVPQVVRERNGFDQVLVQA
jgi:hypothetical protein